MATEETEPDANWEWFGPYIRHVIYTSVCAGVAIGFITLPIEFLIHEVIGVQRMFPMPDHIGGLVAAVLWSILAIYFAHQGTRYEKNFLGE